MAVGRISGPLLKENLIRNGIDLAFETDLLYLDVNNQSIGIKTTSPTHELQVNGTTKTTNLIVDTTANLADVTIEGNTISTTNQFLNLATLDTVVSLNRIRIDSIEIEGNAITTNSSNANLELRPNGTGSVDIHSNLNVTGNIHATGNISADGNIIIGDANTDNVIFNAEIASDIIPNTSNTYSLGSDPDSGGKEWNDVYVNNLVASSVNSQDLSLNGIDLTLRHGNMIYVSENGNDSNSGDHILDPYATIKFALSQATSGDVVHLSSHVYIEQFPLTIPEGVTLQGESIRSVSIQPTTETRYNDAFLLNGQTTISNLTITGFQSGGNFYNSTFANINSVSLNVGPTDVAHTYVNGGTITERGTTYTVTGATYNNVTGILVIAHTGPNQPTGNSNFIKGLVFSCNGDTRTFPDNGYAFRYATDYEATSRSPYIKDITVITSGTTTTVEDPRGFNSEDAGKGAYIDGAYGSASSVNTAMLFHSATFITPGVDAITMTNGARVEWLNSFTYFANRSMFAYDSNAGRRYAGKTKLTLAGVTGTFVQGNTLTITSTDASTVLTGTISSVDGADIYVAGYLDLNGFDLTPQSITDGSATATSITSFDLREFGAEVRLIGSASVYGNFGLVGDGPGVIMYAVGHNLAYIGNGKEVTNETESVIQANEVVEIQGAKIRYNSVDHNGDFRVGDLFYVNQNTGSVTFAVQDFVINTANGVSFETGSDTTFVDGTKIETGDWRFSGNTVETLTQDANFEAASGEINLNSNVNVNGSLDVTGNVTIGGNITIGDEASDTIQIIAGIDSNITPKVDSTYSLGEATKIWSNLYANQINLDNIIIRDNFIETTDSNSNLELRANGTGEVYVPSNNVVLDENLRVYGTTTFNNVDLQGNITQTGNVTQTGNINLTGNLGITGNLTVTAASQFENIKIENNIITTTESNSDLELRATVYGDIVVPSNDVNITNDLYVTGTISVGDINSAGTITANRFSTGDILIDDNIITTTASNSNLELRANGTGEVYVPSNNVIIEQDLTVNSNTYLKDTSIIGTVTHTGNVNQIGNINLTGNLDVTGEVIISASVIQFEEIQLSGNSITTTDSNSNLELRANGTGNILVPTNDLVITNNLTVDGTITVGNLTSTSLITANSFSTGDILIDDNFIATTISNSNLELRAAGTGSIIIDTFSINNSTITTSGDITIEPGSDVVIIDATGALELPAGTTAQRPTAVSGQIRFNTDLNRYEGYNGTNWINLKGVEDVDGTTRVTAELTEGANDNTIRFIVDNNTIATIDSTSLSVPQLNVDNIRLDGNVITTTALNTNLSLSANGTGAVTFDNFAFKNNSITNTVNNSITNFNNTANGYVKFAGTYGVVLPVGESGERPPLEFTETGQVRFNTTDSRVEIWDGLNWVSVAGAASGITRNDAEEIALSTVLVLG